MECSMCKTTDMSNPIFFGCDGDAVCSEKCNEKRESQNTIINNMDSNEFTDWMIGLSDLSEI